MKKSVLTILLATTIFAGSLPYNAIAFEEGNNTIIESYEDITYEKGVYTVKNETLKADEDKESAARKYVEPESIVEITDTEISTTLDFTDKNIMSNTQVKINGEIVNYTEEDLEGNKLRIKFNLNSLSDKIEVLTTINLGFMKMNVSFRVILDTSLIPSIPGNRPEDGEGIEPKPEETQEETPEEKPDEEEKEDIVNPTPTPTPTPTPEPEKDEDLTEVPTIKEEGTKLYKLKNEIITNSPIGYNAARAAVGSVSYLEEVQGEKFITIGLSQLDIMNNIRLSLNGNSISYEVVRQDSKNNTMDIRFKVPSLESLIKVNAYITVTGMDISFEIDFLENTLELISSSEINTPLTEKTTPIVNLNEVQDTKDENKEDIIEEKVEAKEYFKRYTIENDIISDSKMGKTMTRKYLDKISILEDIDGKMYLTIKFSGTNAMDNIKIYVNGEEVSYTVAAEDSENNIKAFRFLIGNVSDEIKISMHIKPIGMDIEFGIDLLEETQTLIEEGVISSEEKLSNENSTDQLMNSYLANSSSESKSTGKVIIVTAISTALIIFLVEGIIYLIIKKRRKMNGD